MKVTVGGETRTYRTVSFDPARNEVLLIEQVKTLNKLRGADVLNPDNRVKVSRQDVKRIMRASILFYPVNSVWKNLPTRVIRT